MSPTGLSITANLQQKTFTYITNLLLNEYVILRGVENIITKLAIVHYVKYPHNVFKSRPADFPKMRLYEGNGKVYIFYLERRFRSETFCIFSR